MNIVACPVCGGSGRASFAANGWTEHSKCSSCKGKSIVDLDKKREVNQNDRSVD
jgi:DnaJ-class molecular chaperone